MPTPDYPLRLVVAVILLLSSSPSATGQPSSPLTFEVASIRMSSPDARPSNRITDTRIDMINQPLRLVLLTAFRLQPMESFYLVAPEWVDRTRVDIQATIPAGRSRRDVPEMLRTLLTERFGLRTHVEQREMDVHELRVDEGGLKMIEVPPVDELTPVLESDASLPRTAIDNETVDGRVRTSLIPRGMRFTTTRTQYTRTGTRNGTEVLDAARMSIAELASVLLWQVDGPVLDRTGLTGLYKFTVELPPAAAGTRKLLELGYTTTFTGTPLTEPTRVSIFKALEGLGLRLERRRSPVDVVVVDSLTPKPTPN